jgi:hypothetical protein
MQALNSDGKCEPGREHANEHFGLVTLIQKATQQQPPGFSGTSSLTLQPRKPMGSCLGTAQRQPGLGTMQRPQLTLVVARQHQHMLRWRHVRADDVFALLHRPPIARPFESLDQVPPESVGTAHFGHRVSEMPGLAASVRVLQWVGPWHAANRPRQQFAWIACRPASRD